MLDPYIHIQLAKSTFISADITLLNKRLFSAQKASVDATMGQLTPSQLIIHREMMKNLKILHAQLAGQPSNDDHEKIREMEDLKLNLDVLGLG